MAESSKGKRSKVAYDPRYIGDGQRLLDDFGRGSDLHGQDLGAHQEQDKGDPGGDGRDRGCRGEEGSDKSQSAVQDEAWPPCLLVRGSPIRGYPCWNCPGGRDYDACLKIRGVK